MGCNCCVRRKVASPTRRILKRIEDTFQYQLPVEKKKKKRKKRLRRKRRMRRSF